MTTSYWNNATQLLANNFICGFCNANVASVTGFSSNQISSYKIYLCPNCKKPNFFDGNKQVPGVLFGEKVLHLPEDVNSLYDEARQSFSVNAYTCSVMACRKILMHIAVAEAAPTNKSFKEYVEYLDSKGFIPPRGKAWVDHIRDKGNEANHEIKLMQKEEAESLITFVGMLLKFIYEFPERVPKKTLT